MGLESTPGGPSRPRTNSSRWRRISRHVPANELLALALRPRCSSHGRVPCPCVAPHDCSSGRRVPCTCVAFSVAPQLGLHFQDAAAAKAAHSLSFAVPFVIWMSLYLTPRPWKVANLSDGHRVSRSHNICVISCVEFRVLACVLTTNVPLPQSPVPLGRGGPLPLARTSSTC